jgi:DNA-binding NarL/FixJ family response regulator
MEESVRVLIADDHPMFRKGLRGLMQSVDGVEVVGEATGGEEAIALAENLQPDVVLMDINMPGVNGIEATRRILHVNPSIGVLVLTMYEDDDSVFAVMRAGARGYLLKGVDQAEVLRAINAVSSGEAIFSPSIASRLIHYFSTLKQTTSQIFPELTDREREVLILIAQGNTNTAIAEKLVLSPKTVRNHVSTIFSKLQVASRAEAIIRARDAGLTE